MSRLGEMLSGAVTKYAGVESGKLVIGFLTPMLFSKIGLVLKNWSPTSILSVRSLVLILLGLVHSLDCLVTSFSGRRVRSTGRVSDCRECGLFLSLNHFENDFEFFLLQIKISFYSFV